MEERNQISEKAYIAEEAKLIGDITIGERSSVFYFAVLRGDEETITIGSCSNIQENCTIHVDEEYPVVIGDYVTVGHNCVLHGCRIGDNSLIGMGSVVMNGAKIGRNCMIGAGSLVTQNTVIPDGMLAVGSPAKVRRALTESEIADLKEGALSYVRQAKKLLGKESDRH